MAETPVFYVKGGSVISKLDFFSRFTDEELEAIYTAAETNVALQVMLDKLKVSEFVTTSDQRLITGMDNLVAAGLLTQEREDCILQ